MDSHISRLSSLAANPGLSNSFPVDCIEALIKFAEHDVTFLDAIKQDGAVTAISLAMDSDPEMDKLMKCGTTALKLFADEEQLRHSMDIIQRSRMEDSFAPQRVKEAISTVASLMMMKENAKYVVNEGGLPILLSIIAGKIKPAGAKTEEAVMLASAIRALGRLLVDKATVTLWVEEGGINSFHDIVNNVSHSELVMSAVCDAVMNVLSTEDGAAVIREKSDLLTLMAAHMLKRFCRYTVSIPKYYNILNHEYSGFLRDGKLVRALTDEGLIEGINNHLSANGGAPDQMVSSMALLESLVRKAQKKLIQRVVDLCSRTMVGSLKRTGKDAEAVHALYQTLYALLDREPKCVAIIKRHGIEQVLAEILDTADVDSQIEKETLTFLSTLIRQDKILAVLNDARSTAQKLSSKPTDIGLIEQMEKHLIFISNVCGAQKIYKTVLDNDGLEILSLCLESLKLSKDCRAREHAIGSTAYAAFNLSRQGHAEPIVKRGFYEQLSNVYLENVAYDRLAEHLVDLSEIILQKADLMEMTLRKKTAATNIAMMRNFPLREDMVSVSATNIGKLAKDDAICQSIVDQGGITVLCDTISSTETAKAIHILRTVESILSKITINGSSADLIDEFGLLSIISAIKRRSEPVLVQQALRIVGLLCKGSGEFCQRFTDSLGLCVTIKNMDYFGGKPDYSGPAMIAVKECCEKADAQSVSDTTPTIVKSISNALDLNSNDKATSSSGVAALAILSGSGPSFTDQVTAKETVDAIAQAMASRPTNKPLIISLATFIINVVSAFGGDLADPKLSAVIDQFKRNGFVDMLTSAASAHKSDAESSAIINRALDAVNPRAKSVLEMISNCITNEAVVLLYVKEILEKLLKFDSTDKEGPFEAKPLCQTLVAVWKQFQLQSEPLLKLLLDILLEMTACPGLLVELLKSQLVEQMMTATIGDANQVMGDMQLGMINVLSDLSARDNGRIYLKKIKCSELVLERALKGIAGSELNANEDESKLSDVDEQILLRGLQSLSSINQTEKQLVALVTSGILIPLQNIVLVSTNHLLAREVLSMLDCIVDISSIFKKGIANAQELHQFMSKVPVYQFDTNPVIMDYCRRITDNLEKYLPAEELVPPPIPSDAKPKPPPVPEDALGDLPSMAPRMSARFSLRPGAAGVPPPVPIDARETFLRAVSRNIGTAEQASALDEFLHAEITEEDIAQLIEQHVESLFLILLVYSVFWLMHLLSSFC